MCKHCADGAPADALLFWEVYMRFGSTRELLQHYSSETEEEALRKLCIERDLNEREVIRRARGQQSADALNSAVKKANAFLTYASPYGYDYVNGILQVKQEEARVVSLIFRRYLEGKGIAKICQELNDRSRLGQPDDSEHPQQPRLLRSLTIERRDQARETRRAD